MTDQEETLVVIGTLVIVTQSIEHTLNTLLKLVIQDGTPLTYERLMQLDVLHRKKTLGFFVKEMKKRAAFEASLDATLERFLENRNKLIHHFYEIPGNDLSTASDIALMNTFLVQLLKDLEIVSVFCSSLLYAWSEQTGIAKDIWEQHSTSESQLFTERVKAMSTIIDDLIFKKNECKK
ncbi:MAG TPA: hypothetical protein DET40_10075 [Lentisphaeria bacterium]|nr:MAG: hypothetical protein A2X45_08860 [Lentisphaerae bacterium GWF2_50_93]HCE43882.1 hypothetical protein [Lentisphaeria bacterium]